MELVRTPQLPIGNWICGLCGCGNHAQEETCSRCTHVKDTTRAEARAMRPATPAKTSAEEETEVVLRRVCSPRQRVG